jgi:hypothetical protein
LCANEGSAATSDSQKIITAAGCFIVGGFAQEARSCFDLAFFFLRIPIRAMRRLGDMQLMAHRFPSSHFPAKLREWN